MDVSLDMWLGEYMEAVQVQFGPRVWFIGLQGSFGRGEATAESDLDVVLILDAVSAADLRAYSAMLDRLPERERVCGFVSGKGELLAWEPADLFQFCHDTRPLLGTLDQVLEKITEGDVHRAVWTGACNVYHMCAHNMVHEKSLDILRALVSICWIYPPGHCLPANGAICQEETGAVPPVAAGGPAHSGGGHGAEADPGSAGGVLPRLVRGFAALGFCLGSEIGRSRRKTGLS